MQEFDKKLKTIFNYEFVIYKALWLIFLGIGLFLMIIPVDGGFETFSIVPCLLLSWGALYYVSSYMTIHQKGKLLRVYELLKWTPISKAEIRKSRMGYLNRFFMKVGTSAVLLQQIGAVLFGNWSVWNLIYGGAVALIIWLTGVACIYFGK